MFRSMYGFVVVESRDGVRQVEGRHDGERWSLWWGEETKGKPGGWKQESENSGV
jgi:hypothetical protein